jgi:restriction endonuclease S subunit
MKDQSVRLGELGEWGSGGTPLASRADYYGGGIPWLIIEDINDEVVRKSARTISKAGLENSSAKIVPPGTLLIAMYGSIGKLGVAEIECATNQAIAFCKCDPSKVDTRFLFFLLLHERPHFIRAGRGGTQQNISQEFLKNYEICLPSLNEQRQIARRLEQADRLRRFRRYALKLTDTFLPAAFVKFFGDPFAVPSAELARLEDVLEVEPQNGLYVPTDRYVANGDPRSTEMVHMSDLFGGIVAPGDLKRAFLETSEVAKYQLSERDLLVAR